MKTQLFLVLVIVLFPFSFCTAQTPTLWGMTEYGGLQGFGTIFSYNIASDTETVQFNFDSLNGDGPASALLQANNGLLYGVALDGGFDTAAFGADGTVFSYNITNSALNVIQECTYPDGIEPYGSLIQAGNGLLYGMTSVEGPYGAGTIFSYNISTDNYTNVHDFGNGTDGMGPWGTLIQANNGLLYGLTQYGGADDTLFSGGSGTIFSYNITADTEIVLHNFGGTTDGYGHPGSLIQANNGLLYGITAEGGVNDTAIGGGGMIFSYDITTGVYTDLHDFGSGVDGATPLANLLQAGNGLLYGMTSEGGVNDVAIGGDGIIFSYNISTGAYTILYNFGKDTADGITPVGSFIQAGNGLLYGTTYFGGVNDVANGGDGTIFSYNITTGKEAVLYSFGSGTDGSGPVFNLIEIDLPTGINQLPATGNQLQIFPNPSSGQFTIKLSDNQNDYPVEIYNMLGEKIEQAVLSNTQNIINLSNQPAGMYFIYLKTEEGTLAGKALITK